MAARTDRFRDLLAALVSVALLAVGGVLGWGLLSGDGPARATTTGVDTDTTESPGDEAVEQVSDAPEEEGPQLRISAQPPTALAVDQARAVLVDVSAPDGTPLPGDTALAVRVWLDPPDTLRGFMTAIPSRASLMAADLRMSAIRIAVAAGAPCDVAAGTLRLRITELGGDGREADHEVELPDVACAPNLKEATEALHMTDPICGQEDPEEGDQSEELRAILDGEDQEQTWCMSRDKARELGLVRERPAPRQEPDDEDDEEEEEDEEEDEEDDNGDDDGDGGNGNDDDEGNGNGGGNGGNGGGNGGGDDGDDGDGDDGDGDDGDGDDGDANAADDGNGDGGDSGDDGDD